MAGITWVKNTLFSGVEDQKKILETKQGLALKRGIEVFKVGFGQSGSVPVVTGRLKGSLLGKQTMAGPTDAKVSVSKEGDALERYDKKGFEQSVTWGSNVEYAEDVELFSQKNAGFFSRNWEANTPRAKEVIKNTLHFDTKITAEQK